MPDGSNLVLQLPRPGEPESAMLPGMGTAAPRETVGDIEIFHDPNIPNTSIGPVALQQPAHWQYDFDPGTHESRTSYRGDLRGPLNIRVPGGAITGLNVTGEQPTITIGGNDAETAYLALRSVLADIIYFDSLNAGGSLGPRWELYFSRLQPGSPMQLLGFTSGSNTPVVKAFSFDNVTGLGTVQANPVDPLGIATKEYVDTHSGPGGGVPEAPITGQIYGRKGSDASWQPVLPLTGGIIDPGPLQIGSSGNPITMTRGASAGSFATVSVTGSLRLQSVSDGYIIMGSGANGAALFVYPPLAGGEIQFNLGGSATGLSFKMPLSMDGPASGPGTIIQFKRPNGALAGTIGMGSGGSLDLNGPGLNLGSSTTGSVNITGPQSSLVQLANGGSGISLQTTANGNISLTATGTGSISLNAVGGNMTVARDPTIPLGIATKQYADTKVPQSGDTTIHGQITMNRLIVRQSGGNIPWALITGDNDSPTFGALLTLQNRATLDGATLRWVGGQLNIAGAAADGTWTDPPWMQINGTNCLMNVPFMLAADPVQPLEAATKQYVDAAIAAAVAAL